MADSFYLLVEDVEPGDVDEKLLVAIMDVLEANGYTLDGISIGCTTCKEPDLG